MSEHNRKTLRNFYCRDYLWDLFEDMSRDLGCSMDYLINESMRHYARSRNYSFSGGGAQPPQQGFNAPAPPAPAPQQPYNGHAAPPPRPEHQTFQRMPAVQPRQAAPAPPAPPYQAPAPAQPPVPQGHFPGYGGQQPQRPPVPPRASAPAFPPRPSAPPPPPVPPVPPRPAAPVPPQRPLAPVSNRLTLVFNNQRYPVDKEKFIIGRGSTMTDLTIRDGNISRKHAAVIFRNGHYYIKDLDSTNGIDYQGNRIDSKKVEEGDIFSICDYEIRFTYQA